MNISNAYRLSSDCTMVRVEFSASTNLTIIDLPGLILNPLDNQRPELP